MLEQLTLESTAVKAEKKKPEVKIFYKHWKGFQRAKGKGEIVPKLALSAAMCDVPV